MRTYSIEMGFTGIEREIATSIIEKTTNGWYIKTGETIQPMRKKNGDYIMTDNQHKCLLISPILNDLSELFIAVQLLRYSGAFYNNSCFLHMKIDVTDIPADKLINLMNLIYVSSDLLIKSLKCNPDRIFQYAQKISTGLIENLNRKKDITMFELEKTYYRNNDSNADWHREKQCEFGVLKNSILSLDPFFKIQDNDRSFIEFRLFNATFNKNELEYYLMLCNLLIDHAIQSDFCSTNRLMSTHGNDKFVMNNWLKDIGALGENYEGLRHFLTQNLMGYLDSEHGYDNYISIPPEQIIDRNSATFYLEADPFENDFIADIKLLRRNSEA